MNERDIQLLLKCLNLTQSENDHEALAAIRKANEILKKNNKTWNHLYAAPIKQQSAADAFHDMMTKTARNMQEEILRRQAQGQQAQSAYWDRMRREYSK